MALCMGLDVVGLTAYSDSRKSMRISGSSHVYRRQVSAKRWRRERLRRFLDGDFPGDLSTLRFFNCYVQRVAVSFRGFSLYVSFLSVPGMGWIAEFETHLAQIRRSGLNRTDFVHCGHCGRAGVAANVHAQLRPTARTNHDRQRSVEAVGGYVRVFVGDGKKKDVTGRVRRERLALTCGRRTVAKKTKVTKGKGIG
jgi:hypothetical protein